MPGVGWSAITAICLGLAGVCGDKIIDGTETSPHSRPYMAFLKIESYFNKYICGGFLIHRDFILTAAHCEGQRITVTLGAHNLSSNEMAQQQIQVQDIIPHEQYDEVTFANDIMLLKLNHSADLTHEVATIRLPESGESIQPGTSCSVAGWGRTATKGRISDVLREVEVKVQKYCDTTKQICARGSGRKGACIGDSGGPLVCLGSGNLFTAEGIVSYGPDKCEDPESNVYTRLSEYRDWIDQKMEASTSA